MAQSGHQRREKKKEKEEKDSQNTTENPKRNTKERKGIIIIRPERLRVWERGESVFPKIDCIARSARCIVHRERVRSSYTSTVPNDLETIKLLPPVAGSLS